MKVATGMPRLLVEEEAREREEAEEVEERDLESSLVFDSAMLRTDKLVGTQKSRIEIAQGDAGTAERERAAQVVECHQQLGMNRMAGSLFVVCARRRRRLMSAIATEGLYGMI